MCEGFWKKRQRGVVGGIGGIGMVGVIRIIGVRRGGFKIGARARPVRKWLSHDHALKGPNALGIY